MNDHHRTRGRTPVVIAGLSVLLVMAAFVAPDAWLQKVADLFDADIAEPTAFSDEARALDEALDQDGPLAFPSERIRELAPHVGVRRALRAGPMTSEEVQRATRLFREALDVEEGVHVELPTLRDDLLRECPRLDPRRLDQELADFRRQLQLRRPALRSSGPAGGRAEGSCVSCHSETQLLPDGRTFDIAGVYPHVYSHPALEGGRRIPVMAEAIELWRDGQSPQCGTCHVPHDEPGFETTIEDRVANMDMWVTPARAERDSIVHVRVKLRNNDSGHRAPGGDPGAAYVVTVEGFSGETPLPLRYGRRLPSHLRDDHRIAGQTFARHMTTKSGRVTTDPTEAHDLVDDTRLQSGRFVEEDYVFDADADAPARIVVTLWYLPDFADWQGAQPVRRVEKTVS